jgi:small subunit ribosomal protein S8
MSMNDPIADLLTRIRNGLTAGHDRIHVPASRLKEEICRVLKEEGYIEDYRPLEGAGAGTLEVSLKYLEDRSAAIKGLRRVSRPSLRVYAKTDKLPNVLSGLGVAIVTTSNGIMTNKRARDENTGGEVLCEVW